MLEDRPITIQPQKQTDLWVGSRDVFLVKKMRKMHLYEREIIFTTDHNGKAHARKIGRCVKILNALHIAGYVKYLNFPYPFWMIQTQIT